MKRFPIIISAFLFLVICSREQSPPTGLKETSERYFKILNEFDFAPPIGHGQNLVDFMDPTLSSMERLSRAESLDFNRRQKMESERARLERRFADSGLQSFDVKIIETEKIKREYKLINDKWQSCFLINLEFTIRTRKPVHTAKGRFNVIREYRTLPSCWEFNLGTWYINLSMTKQLEPQVREQFPGVLRGEND